MLASVFTPLDNFFDSSAVRRSAAPRTPSRHRSSAFEAAKPSVRRTEGLTKAVLQSSSAKNVLEARGRHRRRADGRVRRTSVLT